MLGKLNMNRAKILFGCRAHSAYPESAAALQHLQR